MTNVYEGRGPVPFPPPLVYIAGFGLGLLIESVVPSPQLPAWLRITGASAGLALIVLLDTRAMLLFRRRGTPVNPARPAEALVTDGPYRFTRNPMYLGMASAYAGVALATGALWSLAVLPIVMLVVDRAIVPREEAHLATSIGEEYERYRRRVRRWL